MQTLTREQIEEQLAALAKIEIEAKNEIVDLLEIPTEIIDDVNINARRFNVDIEVCHHNVFHISKVFDDEIRYEGSIYSTGINARTDEAKRTEYKKIISVFVKTLDIDITEKLVEILKKYMAVAAEIEGK